MNHIKLLIILVFFQLQLNGQVNVISYNIRYNTPNDGVHAWPNRQDDVINLLKFHRAGIFCLQEALAGQVGQIDLAFVDFSYAGVGRDDGMSKGEFAPVFFDSVRFKKINAGHFWLSEKPGIPGAGWDAACIRICTWVNLQEKSSDRRFFVFNTHFDHIGVEARKKSATLIIDKIKEIAKDEPAVLCGDFNLPPDTDPIRKISTYLHDSYRVTELPPHASVSTWAGFTYDDPPGERIDYIFVSEGIKVIRYAGLTDSRNRSFFSDHLPVLAEIEL
ncbi:MAG: endonuclease/exonuclease/phosphatase family protein [Bacteroidales bacterium]|nr:endonuclease/exonuclease/phosphatase family protein [Bacteroidales bacterium]